MRAAEVGASRSLVSTRKPWRSIDAARFHDNYVVSQASPAVPRAVAGVPCTRLEVHRDGEPADNFYGAVLKLGDAR